MDNCTKKSEICPVNSDRVDTFKKMWRLLEIERRRFLDEDWRHYSRIIPQQQFIHLMSVRFSLPCNLSRIMKLTGMTSAGASIFVEKMVKTGIFERIVDPKDRRNVIIKLTDRAQEGIASLDNRLNRFIYGFFAGCSEEELENLHKASELVCRVLEKQ